MKPTWLTGAIFVGEENGNYRWNQKGLRDTDNFYLERISDRRMVRIHSAFPDDIEDYHPDSFNSTVDPRVFVLSSYCQVGKKCSPFSYCGALDDDNK